MKTRILFLATCFIFSAAVYSQKTDESVILISEEHLISLIKKIKEKRDALLFENENKNNQPFLSDYDTAAESYSGFNSQQQSQLNAIYAKLQTLEYDIKLLSVAMSSSQKTTDKKGSLTVVTAPRNVAPTYSTIATERSKTDTRNANEISELEKKITALKKDAKEQLLAQEKKETLKRSNNNYDELIRILNSRKSSVDTLVIENRELSNYPDLMKKFDDFQSEVYFDNNSKTVNLDQIEPLDKIVSILKSTEKIDVYLNGFASNRGNPVYNQNLSVERTESIKKYLIKKGIHPSRILTQYHGIDYNAINEELARRVELSFIIRK